MSRADEAHGDVFADVDQLVVPAGSEAVDGPLHVLEVEKRLDGQIVAGALRLALLPSGLLHLNVRAVAKHNVTEVRRGLGQIDPAAEALLAQQRQSAGVVDMCVRQQYEIQRRSFDGKVLIDKNILALFHAEVHKAAAAVDLQKRTAAGDLMRRAEKDDLHRLSLRFSVF